MPTSIPSVHPPHCSHQHAFDSGNPAAERGTRVVMWLTLVTMAVEITAGWWFNSMALLADGWHMSSHAVAIGLSALAYAMARRLVADPRFAFGTWKIEVLAGYSSALFLLGVASMMVAGSVERLLDPQPIRYAEAMAVGVLGLVVNLASAFILGHAHHDHGHGHGHEDGHAHGHDHHDDLNLRSAYLHVIADAATSVLAIAALAGGWWFGWSWLDPVMGVVGAVLVAIWAKGLIVETGKVLLDREMDHPVVEEIREVIAEHAAADGLRLTDLHVWRVGRGAWACALTLFTHNGTLTADDVRRWLSVHEEIVHVTVELQRG
ncbi:CDF family Co(II)/Ni(II) efflux transporter DmeF [Hydrogenophaga sp. RWCD_12]|uniref:CDF family Co(II)/Ni(II) efflux transporter DmeF n=1 Tax=Hydrogenophaga sp. RWCD_12 TaxID=3391190 RepID=UPI0039856187